MPIIFILFVLLSYSLHAQEEGVAFTVSKRIEIRLLPELDTIENCRSIMQHIIGIPIEQIDSISISHGTVKKDTAIYIYSKILGADTLRMFMQRHTGWQEIFAKPITVIACPPSLLPSIYLNGRGVAAIYAKPGLRRNNRKR